MAPATNPTTSTLPDSPPVFPTPEEFVERQGGFDYIVVGGGTAGLVVAARCVSSPPDRIKSNRWGDDMSLHEWLIHLSFQ